MTGFLEKAKDVWEKTFILRIILSIGLYVSDIGTDGFRARGYYDSGDVNWFRFTLAFILIAYVLTLLLGHKTSFEYLKFNIR